MTYATMNLQQPQAQPQMQAFAGPASAIFQPGFAGTNVQEVRALNAGQPAPSAAAGTYAAQGTAGSSINAVFQPGFAGTNVQEVRALNAGQPAPAIAGPYGQSYQQAYPQAYQAMNQAQPFGGAQMSTFSGGAGSIFQPGFAGTDIQEVRARNAGTYQPLSAMAGGITSVFHPGFAGTNVQEVRALNAGYPAPAAAGQSYANAAPQYTPSFGVQQMNTAQLHQQPFAPSLANPAANAIFQPGFANTNVQEVRSDYALSQQNTQQPYAAYRSY
ncbi:MAG: hypothetical protein H0Z34_08215 [Brevibacillus sp.]|nr:hypothetical protein [Brevibacillus sp.]